MKKNKKTVKKAEKKRKTAKPEKIYWSQKKTTGRFNEKDFVSTVIFFNGVPVSMTTLYAGTPS